MKFKIFNYILLSIIFSQNNEAIQLQDETEDSAFLNGKVLTSGTYFGTL